MCRFGEGKLTEREMGRRGIASKGGEKQESCGYQVKNEEEVEERSYGCTDETGDRGDGD